MHEHQLQLYVRDNGISGEIYCYSWQYKSCPASSIANRTAAIMDVTEPALCGFFIAIYPFTRINLGLSLIRDKYEKPAMCGFFMQVCKWWQEKHRHFIAIKNSGNKKATRESGLII